MFYLQQEPSLISVSDSLFYIDFGASHQPLETADDSALFLNDKVKSIVSRSVSCPILTPVIPEHNDDCSQRDSQPEISTTLAEQEEIVVDYGDLLAKHSECCINPCGLDCPMYPVETSEVVTKLSKGDSQHWQAHWLQLHILRSTAA